MLRAAEAAAAAAQAAAAAAQAASLPPVEPVAEPEPAAAVAAPEPAAPVAEPAPPPEPIAPAPRVVQVEAAVMVQRPGPVARIETLPEPIAPAPRVVQVEAARSWCSGPARCARIDDPPARACARRAVGARGAPELTASPELGAPREPLIHEAGAAQRLLAAAGELEAHVAQARRQLDALEEALGRLERGDQPGE